MSTPVVAVGGIVGVAALAGGAYLVYDFSSKDTLVTLEQKEIAEGKFGKEYASYFLSADKGENKSRWASNFERFEKATTINNAGFFKDAQGEGKKTIENFKTACKTQYEENRGTTEDDKWEEVWTYCSLGTSPLLTLENSSDDTEKTAYTGSGINIGITNKTKLLSVDSEENKWFWEIRNKEWGKTLNPVKNTDQYFHNQKTTNSNKKLSEICAAAYKVTATGSTSSNTQPKLEEIMKFCSHKKQTTA